MTAEVTAGILQEQGYKARLKDGSYIFLTDSDVETLFDEAVRLLHDEPVGTICELHRLIVRKTNQGYDIFVMAGVIE